MSAAAKDKTDGQAVWQPGMGFIQTVHETCEARKAPDFGKCLVEMMPGAGAPPPAVAGVFV